MGRGGRRSPSRARTLRPYVVGEAAREEFRAVLRYIKRESDRGARTVFERVDRKIRYLRRFPQSAPVDEQAPGVPGRAKARKAYAAGFTIRYLYPVEIGDRPDGLLVVSILRSQRLPIDDAEFVARYAMEQLRLRAHREQQS